MMLSMEPSMQHYGRLFPCLCRHCLQDDMPSTCTPSVSQKNYIDMFACLKLSMQTTSA